MNIIYEDNHLLVVEKPVNVPVQADASQDSDLLTMLKQYLKEKYTKPGNVYLGLVHRLDRPVGGVMVFAKTSKAASRLSKQVQDHIFEKTYLAVVNGRPEKDEDEWTDFLEKDHDTNTVRISPNGRKAVLSYRTINTTAENSLLEISLQTGRSHQIRVQCASHGCPIWGDQRYNDKAVRGQQIALWAYRLRFTHPVSGKEMTFTCRPPANRQPWKEMEIHNEQ